MLEDGIIKLVKNFLCIGGQVTVIIKTEIPFF